LQTFNIQDYGIGITTLEEVFLKVAEIDHGQLAFDKKLEEEKKKVMDMEKMDEFDDAIKKDQLSGYWALFMVHFIALMIKRTQYIMRDLKGLAGEILVPMAIVCGGLGIQLVTFIY